MSKSSTASSVKQPTVLPNKSAWAKGPPAAAASSSAPSPRSSSPALPPTPTNSNAPHLTHSRRPSGLGPGIPIKEGVTVPRSTVSAVKPSGSAVTFGSIDEPVPAAAPTKSEVTKPPTPPSTSTNGKSSTTASTSKSTSAPPVATSASTSSLTAKTTSTPPTVTQTAPTPVKKVAQFDVAKLFQGSGSSTPPSVQSQPPSNASDTSSPSVRSSTLPSTPSSQSSQLSPHYTPFVPGQGMRPAPLQGQQGQNGGGGPRSPTYPRGMPNGNGPRTPGGPNSNGPPPMSPRLGGPNMHGQPSGMPSGMPPPQVPVPGWAGYYYQPQPGDPYVGMNPYGPQWYGAPSGMPSHNGMPPHPQHPHHAPHLHPGAPGHSGMPPMSPRHPSQQLQSPSTPTQSHAMPIPQPSGGPGGLTSPPQTPNSGGLGAPPSNGVGASPIGRSLSSHANAFVPHHRAPSKTVTLKREDGTEVDLTSLNKSATPPASTGNGLPAAAIQAPAFKPSHAPRVSVIRMETEDARRKRIEAEEKAEQEKVKAKLEVERKKKEEEERKIREEAEAKKAAEEEAERMKQEEEERIRKEKEEAEMKRLEEEQRIAKEKEEEERKAREVAEAEAKKKAEEEAAAAAAKVLEEEKARKLKEEEEAAKAAAAKPKEPTPPADPVPFPKTTPPEEGEIDEATPLPSEALAAGKAVAALRIDTATAIKPSNKARPGPLDLSHAQKSNVVAPLPSALATARIIDDFGKVPYPEGIMSPKIELNQNAQGGKFRYDRDFLLQFMQICKEKPDMLPPLDAIGLEPAEQNHTMSRSNSQQHRTRHPSIGGGSTNRGLGINFPPSQSGSFSKASNNPFNPMGNFATGPSKLSSEERFRIASNPSLPAGARPTPIQRTPSLGGAGAPLHRPERERNRSKRGHDRGKDQSGHQQHGSRFENAPLMGGGLDIIEPLGPKTESTWVASSISRKPQPIDPDAPEIVEKKVKALLNKLSMEKFDSISDQVIAWANKSEKEKDGRTLIQVIRLVFEKATDEATWSEMYARLCRKMMEQLSTKVQDDGIKNAEGKPIAGGQLFRKYLLNRCQEDFERGWVQKEATAAAAAIKATEDQATRASNEQAADGKNDGEIALYSDEYYAAQKAKRQGLGLIKFIGELFKLQMLTERIMHECIKKLLGNVENPEEEEIESLCKLLGTVGGILDTAKARAHLDVYFSRMRELVKSPNVNSRMQFMLQDVIELRDRKWQPRNAVAAPTTIAQIHENAAKEKAAAEKEQYQRQMSMSRGGSRRGGERGDDPNGWAVAGNGPPRPPPKAGDLTNFGKINKTTPMTFGPSSVFSKKESKRESVSRVASSSNMFSMLQNSESPPDASAAARPGPGRKAVDTPAPSEPPQRRRIVLQPRTKPLEGEAAGTPAGSDDGSEDEPVPAGMSEEAAKTKIEEDSKEFFGVRNLGEAEDYFVKLPEEHRFRLVEKLVSTAIESKEADAQLVGDFFALAVSKQLCSPASFEAGFDPVAEMLDDLVIDAPKAFQFMAIMMKGAQLDSAAYGRLASKSMDIDKLLELLS